MDNPYLAPRAPLGVPDASSGHGLAPAVTIAELRQTRTWLYVMIAGGVLGSVAQAALTIVISGLSVWLAPTYLVFNASALVAVWFLVRVAAALGEAVAAPSLESVRRVIAAFSIAAFVGAGLELVRNTASLIVSAGLGGSASIAAFTSPPLATLTDTMRRFRLALALSAIVSIAMTFANYRIYTYGSWYVHLFSAGGLVVLGLEVWQIVSAGRFVGDPSGEHLDVWAKATRVRCCVQGVVSVAGALGSLGTAWSWYRMH